MSGHEYHGINVFLLGCQGCSSPFWVTYKQAAELGGSVRAGERATPVVFWKWIEKRGTDGGRREGEISNRDRMVPLLRYYSVFNFDQTELVRHKRLAELAHPEPRRFDAIEAADAIVRGYPSAPPIDHGGDKACYSPARDRVYMPKPETFESARAYYSTLFHELTHSTGHKSRLDREFGPRFADHLYSKEELVAEMGASFLRAFSGIDSEGLVDNSAAYLASWLKVLRRDSKMLVMAAAQAQRAADWIRGERHAD